MTVPDVCPSQRYAVRSRLARESARRIARDDLVDDDVGTGLVRKSECCIRCPDSSVYAMHSPNVPITTPVDQHTTVIAVLDSNVGELKSVGVPILDAVAAHRVAVYMVHLNVPIGWFTSVGVQLLEPDGTPPGVTKSHILQQHVVTESDPYGVLRGVTDDKVPDRDVRFVAALEEVLADDFISVNGSTLEIVNLVALQYDLLGRVLRDLCRFERGAACTREGE